MSPPPPSAPVRAARRVGAILLLAGVYYAAARVALGAAAAHAVVSSVWPPAGIALFALLRFGPHLWPGVALGAFLLNATSGVAPWAAALIAAGNTLEALAGAWLLTRAARFHRALDRVRDVLALAGFAAVASTAVAAAIGVTSLWLSGSAQAAQLPELWSVWWSGDAVGVLVVTPLLLTWAEPERFPARTPLRTLEAVLLFVVLLVGTDLMFRQPTGLVYGVFPLVTWIALRLGRRGAATAVALVTVLATWHTVTGVGPFASLTPLTNLFALQVFLALLSVPSLLFAASRAEVLDSRERLAALSRRLIAAQEEERRRVAREIHDELGQALTGVKMGLGSLRPQSPRRDSADVERRITGVSSVVDGAIEAVQRIILRLRPAVLDSLGPIAALEWAVDQFKARSGLAIELSLPREQFALDDERSVTLFRTAQEALTNVARHANATRVRVDLERRDGELVLRITDDGRGIGEADLRKPDSLGILGMRERAMACGGTLDLRRGDGGGTCLTLTVPLSDDAGASVGG